jgi:hypothetical protein
VGTDVGTFSMAERNTVSFQLENPDKFPAYVYAGYPDDDPYDTEVKRGGPFFETVKQSGLRVTRLPPGPIEGFPISRPWTFVFVSVPFTDVSEALDQLQKLSCSVIFDCHFPIMELERVSAPSDDTIFQVIENKEVILSNLAQACAVTVPHKEWAADLVHVNPRVWWLPDIESEDDEESCMQFAGKFMEMAVSTHQQCSSSRAESADV